IRPKAHVSLSIPQWANKFEQESPGATRYPVEVRYPFLDLRVVNFLLALPPFPLFFEKQLLREAVAGRLPENVRTRPKTPMAGSPLVTHFRQTKTAWMDKMAWDAQMDSYVNRTALTMFRNETNSEQANSGVRPLCLN